MASRVVQDRVEVWGSFRTECKRRNLWGPFLAARCILKVLVRQVRETLSGPRAGFKPDAEAYSTVNHHYR